MYKGRSGGAHFVVRHNTTRDVRDRLRRGLRCGFFAHLTTELRVTIRSELGFKKYLGSNMSWTLQSICPGTP